MRLATLTGMGNRDRKYVGKLERVLLMRVTLPPLDKYKRFQPSSLLSIFSRIGFQIDLSLNLAPKGRPKYFIGREPYLHPRTAKKRSICWTAPTGTISDLPKLIFRPDTASNQIRIKRRINMCSSIHIWKPQFR